MNFLRAFKPIALDLIATIFFAVLFWATGNILLATLIGVAVGLGRFVYLRVKGLPIGPLQYLSVVLVIVAGITTLVTHNPQFMMIKSSLVTAAVGVVMLTTNWMAPYLPPIVTENLERGIINVASRGWGVLEIVLAVANAFVALNYSVATWTWYTSVVPTSASVGAFLIQYVIFRTLIRRKITAKMAQGATPPAAGEQTLRA
jgi:intracellular septation protein